MKSLPVRALYRAARVPGRPAPYDTLTLKIYYPGQYGDTPAERDSGFIPADTSRAPFPVVIILPGINISPEAYAWLAQALARAGYVAVTYSWVTVELADLISASPGLEFDALRHERFGCAPSCPALPTILGELGRMQESGLLAGLLDTDRVVLGGHSAGGTMALLNANSDWFAGVCAAFSYAAHSTGNPQLGWPEHSIIPLPDTLPLLIMGGNRDGVIPGSSHRYGSNDPAVASPIERTFREGLTGNAGGRHLVIFEGANHFSFVWPDDKTTGRAYLERPAANGRQLRTFMARMIVNFCNRACGDEAAAGILEQMFNNPHPLVAEAETR